MTTSRTIQIKGYTRRGKNGKTVKVKGYTRTYTPKNRPTMDNTKKAPGQEYLNKKSEPKETRESKWGGPAPKWTADDYQVMKETQGMSLSQMKQYMKNREQLKGVREKAQQVRTKKPSLLSRIFKRK